MLAYIQASFKDSYCRLPLCGQDVAKATGTRKIRSCSYSCSSSSLSLRSLCPFPFPFPVLCSGSHPVLRCRNSASACEIETWSRCESESGNASASASGPSRAPRWPAPRASARDGVSRSCSCSLICFGSRYCFDSGSGFWKSTTTPCCATSILKSRRRRRTSTLTATSRMSSTSRSALVCARARARRSAVVRTSQRRRRNARRGAWRGSHPPFRVCVA